MVDHPDMTLDVALQDLGETTQGLIRVQASDGFHTTQDSSDGTFTTPNTSPKVQILSPLSDQINIPLPSFIQTRLKPISFATKGYRSDSCENVR